MFFLLLLLCRILPRAVHYGIEPVSYGQHRAVLELSAYRFLYQLVRIVIDGGGGLIQNKYFGLAEKSASQANELSLAHTQIVATLGALEVKFVVLLHDEVLQVGQLDGVPELVVAVLRERVEIHANCARKNNRILCVLFLFCLK